MPTLVDGRLCPECYLELYGFGKPPSEIIVTICPRCGSYRFQGNWYPSPGSIEDVIALTFQALFKPSEYTEYYRVDKVEVDYENNTAVIKLVGRLKGDNIERSTVYTTRLIIRKQLCPVCLKKASGAPSAIIQIRSYRGKLGEDERAAVEELLASLDTGVRDAIISTNNVREGIDINLVDQNIARTIASRFRSKLGAFIKESHKLITQRRDGRKVTRLTLSVRLPFFFPGALVDYRGSLARVEDIDHGYVILRLLGTRSHRRLRVEEAWRILSEPKGLEKIRVIVAALEPGWVHVQEIGGAYNYLELPRSSTVLEGDVRPGRDAILIKFRNKYYVIAKGNH